MIDMSVQKLIEKKKKIQERIVGTSDPIEKKNLTEKLKKVSNKLVPVIKKSIVAYE